MIKYNEDQLQNYERIFKLRTISNLRVRLENVSVTHFTPIFLLHRNLSLTLLKKNYRQKFLTYKKVFTNFIVIYLFIVECTFML